MKEIADLLQVTARTVAFHKYTILENLDLKTSAELVQYALERGMLKKRRECVHRNTVSFDSIGDFQKRLIIGAVIASSSIPGGGSAERPRVLLADDHPAVLALTAAVLADGCLVVGGVGDGQELLTEAERLDPDVIVLDISMPRLDGIEAARQLRRSQRPARLVFLTVHEDADFARAALDAGGLGYVVKARLASDLLPAIRAALADRRFISPTISLQENA